MAKYGAFGALFKRGDGGGPETFATVGNVSNIGGPSLGADAIEATSHDSPGGYEEVVIGILRTGEVSLEAQFDPDNTTHIGLRTDMTGRVKRNFQLVFPDAGPATWSFAGFVTAYAPAAPVEGLLTVAVTIKLTGQPTLV